MVFVPVPELSGIVRKWREPITAKVLVRLSLRSFIVDLFFRLDGLLRLSPRRPGESYGSLLSYLLGKI